MTRTGIALVGFGTAVALPWLAGAQTLGTFRWQLQPYCNVVAVTITQNGGLYRLEGTDDQCGGGRDQAAVLGMAFPNPDGTIGFGMTIVTAPGGVPVHVDADITIPALSGNWRDSAGDTGTFAFTPGASSGGNARPPASVIPMSITMTTGGSVVARSNGNDPIPATGPGTRMLWHAAKGAFRVGAAVGTEWDDVNVGVRSLAFGTATKASGRNGFAGGDSTVASGSNSVAFGFGTTASGSPSLAAGIGASASGTNGVALGQNTMSSGFSSLAAGQDSTASGDRSTAFGLSTTASGSASLAAGRNTVASGDSSTAIGSGTTAGPFALAGGAGSLASGNTSLAFGDQTSAAGNRSVTLGNRATTTAAARGSFVFADDSSTNAFTSFTPNQFIVRAAGGLGVYTNAATTTGAEMAPGGGAWAALSDASMKENFRDVDGEDVLAKLARVPVREWNYTSQDASIRHLGPTAQDFRAAFGLGEFERRITSTDADGVALAGVRALDARTREMRDTYEERVGELLRRIDALERAVATSTGGAR